MEIEVEILEGELWDCGLLFKSILLGCGVIMAEINNKVGWTFK